MSDEQVMEEPMDRNVTISDNSAFYGASALQIRLDTAKLVSQLQRYLSGAVEVLEQDPQTGEVFTKIIKTGEQLANQKGIQFILGRVESIINPQNVQGNFKDDEDYWKYLTDRRERLACGLMLNLRPFGIKEEHYHGIMDMVMSMVEPFMSRLLHNKERESYAQTIKSYESSTNERGRGGIPIFGRR